MNEKKGLENIVPPPDLCKQIPEGKFDDSALVWARPGNIGVLVGEDDLWEIFERASLEKTEEMLPAPTLAEILEEIDPSFDADITVRHHFGQWTVEYRHYPQDGVASDNDKSTIAALKLWLEVNGAEATND